LHHPGILGCNFYIREILPQSLNQQAGNRERFPGNFPPSRVYGEACSG